MSSADSPAAVVSQSCPQHLRTAKTVSGTTRRFTWDRAQGVPLLLSEGPAGAATRFVYGPGGLPIAQVDAAGNVVYFHHDQLGSTRVLTDASGAVVATSTYDAYGNPTAATGTVSTPLGFAGEYTDAETGFVYLRARYYDPATGQFLSRDPLVALTGEAYGYVGGNPLNATDSLGLFCVGSLCTPRIVGQVLGSAWDATGGQVASTAWEHRDAVATGLALTSGLACLVGSGGTAAIVCGALISTSLGWSLADSRAPYTVT